MNNNCVNIIAKSSNTEKSIKDSLDHVCGNSIRYRYWYGSGLWLIKVYASTPEDFNISAIQHELEYLSLDFSMVFYGKHEIFDESFVRYYDSGHEGIGLQKMEPPTGEIFKINLVTSENED